jgi:hypothetical protein
MTHGYMSGAAMMPPRRMHLACLSIEARTWDAVSLKTALYAPRPKILRVNRGGDQGEHERYERRHG